MFIFGELDAKLVELLWRLCVTFSVFGSRPIGRCVLFCLKERDTSDFVLLNRDKS